MKYRVDKWSEVNELLLRGLLEVAELKEWGTNDRNEATESNGEMQKTWQPD